MEMECTSCVQSSSQGMSIYAVSVKSFVIIAWYRFSFSVDGTMKCTEI